MTAKQNSNAGIKITIDESVLDALDQLHKRVTDAGLFMFFYNHFMEQGMDEGYVCLQPAKKYLDEACDDFSTIFDDIGRSYEDRRKRSRN